jgi:PAS domain S-box-containing protein
MGKATGNKKTTHSPAVPDKNGRIPSELLTQSVMVASCGILVTDCRKKDNPVVFVNPAFEEMSGYEAREILGRHCRLLLGKDREQASLKQFHEAVKHGRRCTAVLRNYRKDGSLFYNELSVAPLRNRSGDVTHLIWLQRDVTTQVEREKEVAGVIADKEERFSAYVENANEAVWRLDFDPPIPLDAPESPQVQGIFSGVFTEANDATARMYGLAKGKEVIGRQFGEFMKQSDPRNLEVMAGLVRSRFRMDNLASYETVADGTTVIMVNNITPGIEEGEVRHIWGATLELSELLEAQDDLKRSTEELKAQKKALAEKNAALKELISHIEADREELKDRIQANVEQVIMPSLEKLRLNNGADMLTEQLRKALEDLTSSFGRKIADSRMKLTPREIEVCSMVRNGLTSKEIARLLNIALHTVEKHRRTARNKLGLANKGVNLSTYLNSL